MSHEGMAGMRASIEDASRPGDMAYRSAERGMLPRVTADRESAFDRLAAELITEPALVAVCRWAGPNARRCGP